MRKLIGNLLKGVYRLSANYIVQSSGLQIEIARAFFKCSEEQTERFNRAEKSALELKDNTGGMNNLEFLAWAIAFIIAGTLLNTLTLVLTPMVMMTLFASKMARQVRKIRIMRQTRKK